MECHGLDNEKQIFFYEQDYYPFSNFSSFKIWWKGILFDTSEQVYHWEKFNPIKTWSTQEQYDIRRAILHSSSAHEVFKLAEKNKDHVRDDWLDVRVSTMLDILCAKVEQHEYVKRKLLNTGDREIIENSWRDSFWGWGPNRDGLNMLGKLWMQIRVDLRKQQYKY